MPPLRVVDLSEPPAGPECTAPGQVVVGVGDPHAPESEYWLQHATFTLVEASSDDRRTVTVAVRRGGAGRSCRSGANGGRTPRRCATTCCAPSMSTRRHSAGVITESLAYSTLQAGPEFARWLAERGPARVPEIPDPVQSYRDGNTLHVRFNRPQRHNAFSTDARAALLEALTVALARPRRRRGRARRATAHPSAVAAISPSSAHSPTRPARIWPAPGTARLSRSTR